MTDSEKAEIRSKEHAVTGVSSLWVDFAAMTQLDEINAGFPAIVEQEENLQYR